MELVKEMAKLATQIMESLSSATKKKLKSDIRKNMMLKNKDDELNNVWVKLKTLTLYDSQETKDFKDVSKLQAADAVDKSHKAKHFVVVSLSKELYSNCSPVPQ